MKDVSAYIDLFKNKNFLVLWIGQIISEFGDRLNQMALIASVYYGIKEGRIVRLGTLLAFTIIPVFIIGPIAGIYSDRWNRKKTMVLSDIIRGLLVLIIPFLIYTNQSIIYIYITVFVIFSVTRFFIPAKLGIIPDIVDREHLLLANSMTTTTRLIATIAGLGLGGIIIELVGVTTGFFIDSATYLLSAAALMFISIKIKKPGAKESFIEHSRRIKNIEKNIFHDIFDGVKYIFKVKEIPYVLKTFFLLMSGIGAVYVIFIDFLLKNITSTNFLLNKFQKISGYGQFGFIIVFFGAGAFLGTVVFGKWGQKLKKQFIIALGFAIGGIMMFLFTFITYLTNNFWYAGISSFFLGMSIAPILVTGNTLLHEVTDTQMRGRIFSFLEIVIHLAFFIFMCLSILFVEKLSIPERYILYCAGLLSILYGLLSMRKHSSKKSTI